MEDTHGRQNKLTARSPSDLGLEMNLAVGLLDVVLLKYFSSFGFIKKTLLLKYITFYFYFDYNESLSFHHSRI